jgi:hypothetical protein
VQEKPQAESLWTKYSGLMAVLVAVVVSALGYILDLLLDLQGVSSAYMLLLTNTVTGIVAGGLFYQMAKHAKSEREMIRARVTTIAEMNHHIRNALQVIKILVAYPPDADQRSKQIKLINESVDRVEWALREVLPKYPAGSSPEPLENPPQPPPVRNGPPRSAITIQPRS